MNGAAKLLLGALLMASCTRQKQAEDPEVVSARLQARVQMELKVNNVVQQLQQDCDSTLLETAVQQADSVWQSRHRPVPVGRKRR